MLSKIPFVAVFIENRFLKFVHLKAKAGGSAADFRKQKIREVLKIAENLAVGSGYKCYALRVARAETRSPPYHCRLKVTQGGLAPRHSLFTPFRQRNSALYVAHKGSFFHHF